MRAPTSRSISHPKALHIVGWKIRDDRRREMVEITLRALRPGVVRHAEHSSQAISHLIPLGCVAQHQFDPPHECPDPDHVEVRHRRADVRNESLDEPRAVSTLERDLLIVDDDRLHDRLWRQTPASATHRGLQRLVRRLG
jgi:hypothetical protein